MKAALALSLLLVIGAGERVFCAQNAPVRVETAEFSGRRYLRLGDWAKANNFELHWQKREEVVQLSNRASRMVFTKDSREAELNGVKVWLSWPIVINNGAGYISELDLQTAIRPVLSPPKNWSGSKVRNIVIDPGHGGRDPGNQDGARQEKKYTLLLAQELSAQLKRAGFNPSLTRTTDAFIDLPVRPDIARRRGADLFISLHWNSVDSGKNEVRGIETYCLTPAGAASSNAGGEIIGAGTKPGNRFNEKNMFLAYELQKTLLKELRAPDRGVRRARFAVLRTAEMPAILLEGGFMSHPAESMRIYDPVSRRQMAHAIVDGILAYKNAVEQGKR
ncbi:MAG TPA: N-acetylmuramoyl-L-alanine amidase [Verrucomicrobiae bacterium]|nr:N-acetylmuramoyl-L-alanine amidase [Verrucomicrobiae bacterium]